MESVQLRHTFLRETEELLEALEQGLLELESASESGDLIDRLFRAAHTLKGNAGMVGFTEAVKLTHVLENVLDRLRAGSLATSPDVISALFLGVDALRAMCNEFRNELPVTETPELKRAYEQLAEHSTHGEAHALGVERRLRVTFHLRPTPLESAEDLGVLLDEIAMVGVIERVETLFDRVPPLTDDACLNLALGAKLELRTTSSPTAVMGVLFLSVDEEDLEVTELEPVASCPDAPLTAEPAERVAVALSNASRFNAVLNSSVPHTVQPMETMNNSTPRAAPAAATHHKSAAQNAATALQSSLRVDTHKLDSLVDLVGELVIGIAQVKAGQLADPSHAQMAVERLELLGRELQDQVMGLRMLPIQETFERFRRPIRDLSKELGKALEFKIVGGETQVDKRVLDSLIDPLKHMLRNCVSHGLESPEERATSGKPPEGTIALSAAHREGHVIIEIADDGRGIDPARVRQKAEEKELISKGQELTDAQAFELIFLPGFSTAESVSEISGRGVGLDVVRKNIQALRGTVEITSALGRGTTFRIRLPLTLAIVDGMNVVVGDETVTIPLRNVVELIALESQTVRRLENEHEFIDVRGELVPMVRLGDVLELPAARVAIDESRVVLVETERRKFGLVVDRVLGMSQTVIKSLDAGYRLVDQAGASFDKPRGISGAAILGDGNVGIIVDVHGIEQLAFEAA